MPIKLKFLEDILNRLSDRVKKRIVTALITVLVTGSGGGGYIMFAKASVVEAQTAVINIHLAMHEVDDTRKDIRLILRLMKEYRDDYGKDLDGATDKEKEIYHDWEDELEDLRDKLKAAKLKAQG